MEIDGCVVCEEWKVVSEERKVVQHGVVALEESGRSKGGGG